MIMKKCIVSLLSLFFASTLIVDAQKKKDVVEEVPVIVYQMEYSLPKVVYKIDVALQEIHNVPGPLVKYAQSKLGIEPKITSEASVWSMKGMSISPVSVPDAACRYIIESSPENPMLQLSVTPNGLLSGVGTSANTEFKPFNAGANIVNSNVAVKDLHTINTYNFLEYVVDSVFVEVKGPKNTVTKQFDPNSPYHYEIKSDEVAIQEILDKIYELRTDRNDLLRGDREVEDDASLATILKSYDAMEHEYMALFLGASDTVVHNYTLYVEPANVKTGQVIFRVSATKGIVDIKDSSAKPVILTYSNVQTSLRQTVQPVITDLVYRVPVTAQVKVSYDNSELMSFNSIIPQWGVVQKFSDIELSKLRLEFYEQYGSLKSAVLK